MTCVTAEPEAMAKKKVVVRNPEDWERKPMIVTMRGAPEYKAVLEELAEFEGVAITALIDRAVRFYARHVNFPKQFPKR